jgi:hypothetical protein
MTDAFPSMGLQDAIAQQQLATSGDPAARAFFDGLFTKDDECFTCAGPVGTHVTVQIIADPRHRGQAIFAPLCDACASRPALELRARCIRMVRAMWPKSRRWDALQVPRLTKKQRSGMPGARP